MPKNSDVKINQIVRVQCPMKDCTSLKPDATFEARFDLDLDHEDAEVVRYGGECPECGRTIFLEMDKEP